MSAPQDNIRALPHAVGPEKSVLSSILQEPSEYLPKAHSLGLTKDHFYLPAHSTLYGFLVEIHAKGKEIELVSLIQKLIDKGLLDRIGGPASLTDIYNYSPSPSHFATYLEMIFQKHRARRAIEFHTQGIEAIFDSPEESDEAIRKVGEELAGITSTVKTGIMDKLANRRFNAGIEMARPVPVIRLGENIISTPGNITNIQAPPKAGKSAALGAMLASIFTKTHGVDTLGFYADNSEGKAVLHFDTEQSRYDHDQLVRRALRRAKVNEPPPWFYSYSMADLGYLERLAGLENVIRCATRECGGVFAIFLDGIADFCADPNDATEAFGLVEKIHGLAIKHDCAVFTVLHENPGSEIGKTRGHLGSQLERKVETPLRLAKDSNGITTIWADRARHCNISKDGGTCFEWSGEAGMHVSCGNAREIKSAAKRVTMQTEAETAFGDSESLSYTDLFTAIMAKLDLGERSAKGRVRLWLAEGITRKSATGNHLLSNP
jgi:hypothetical protein